MDLYGKKITKSNISKYVGDISQIADARESRLTSGKADGVRVIDVKTGGGLTFTVVPSRAMDIAWAEYKGVPLAHISKTGMVNPAFYDKEGLEFLRGFYCGMITTCGLTYLGAPCEDQGEKLGLHGRISNTPASDVSVYREWEGDDYVIRIRGKVQESCVFRENIVLTREISVKMGGKTIHVKDSIENTGFEDQPLMLLYHVNFGYPIVSEDTALITSKSKTVARDAEAQKGINDFMRFQEPTPGYNEQVFYHDLEPAKDGSVFASLFNEKIDLGAYVKANKNQMKYFGEWKMMGGGDYVVGLEPSNCKPEGRAKARERRELEFLKPGETRCFDLEVGVLESKKEIDNIL